jgi:hypothetical protein
MSEHESLFVTEMKAILEKVRSYHRNTVKVVFACVTVVVTVGCLVIAQGFKTSRDSARATSELKQVSETQTLMYEVFNTQISDVKARATENKIELNGKIIENKADLQRQLDMIMKDRKIVERGSNK